MVAGERIAGKIGKKRQQQQRIPFGNDNQRNEHNNSESKNLQRRIFGGFYRAVGWV
jgi:hypothetical protein